MLAFNFTFRIHSEYLITGRALMLLKQNTAILEVKNET